MSDGQLPAPRRYRCAHGLCLPGAAQVGYIASALSHKDFGSAIAVCVDWCDICTGLIDATTDGGGAG